MINNITQIETDTAFYDDPAWDAFESIQAAERLRTNVFVRFKSETVSWVDFSDRVEQIYEYLVPGCDFTAPELMGNEYWQELSPLNRRLAVLFLKQEAKDHPSYLVETTRGLHGDICFQVGQAN